MDFIVNEYIKIWKNEANINLENHLDKNELFNKLNRIAYNKNNINSTLKYGNHCGPCFNCNIDGNDHSVDCLDFSCFLHDKFFHTNNVDIAFIKSIKLLHNNNLIYHPSKIHSLSHLISNPLIFPIFTFYRNQRIFSILL